jgi:carbonic anhydrase
MGHSKCGAVTAAVQGAEVHGHIPKLLSGVKKAVKKARKAAPEAEGDELIDQAIRANVWYGIERVLTKSDEAGALARAGKLSVVGAVYDIGTGQVEWLGPHPEQDKLLAKGARKAKGGQPSAHRP